MIITIMIITLQDVYNLAYTGEPVYIGIDFPATEEYGKAHRMGIEQRFLDMCIGKKLVAPGSETIRRLSEVKEHIEKIRKKYWKR